MDKERAKTVETSVALASLLAHSAPEVLVLEAGTGTYGVYDAVVEELTHRSRIISKDSAIKSKPFRPGDAYDPVATMLAAVEQEEILHPGAMETPLADSTIRQLARRAARLRALEYRMASAGAFLKGGWREREFESINTAMRQVLEVGSLPKEFEEGAAKHAWTSAHAAWSKMLKEGVSLSGGTGEHINQVYDLLEERDVAALITHLPGHRFEVLDLAPAWMIHLMGNPSPYLTSNPVRLGQ